MNELTIITNQQPGIASLENFDELKAYLEERLEVYRHLIYTEDNVDAAKNDKKTLSKLKKSLDDKRKEIKKVYMAPYLEAEAKIKELMALIEEPLGLISAFVSDYDQKVKEAKRNEIKEYYNKRAGALGDFSDTLFYADGFFDPKWENKTTSAKVWQEALDVKIAKAASDIATIQSAGGTHTTALLTKYFECLDIEKTIDYKKVLETTEQMSTSEVIVNDDDDHIVGYKILKIFGTQRQMAHLMDQLDLMDMEYDEIEDGMPREMEELTTPNFDTFVAFDIETSGTYGAAHGDAPAEITEIGAVKVVHGEIVERIDWLCNPGRKILPRIARLTNITDEMVANEPPVGEVIRRFADFVGELPLVGHNIKASDMHYISRAAKKAGIALENSYFDTYRYAKLFKETHDWENVKLEYLSKQFGIAQPDAHRAWCDAEANVGVYFELKKL